MEIVDLDLGEQNSEPIRLNLNEKTYDFDNSVDLLINDRNTKMKRSTSNGFSSIQNLENELNDLAKPASSGQDTKTFGNFGSSFTNMFNFSSSAKNPPNYEATDSNVGQATKDTISGNTKTWDGFTKVNEVPQQASHQTNMSEREKNKKKRLMIKKLEEWYERGHIKHNSHFDMNSPYDEVEDEYESAIEDKRKKDSLKLQGWWLKTMVNSVEFANTAFDPFGLDLNGLSEQVEEDLDSYEEVFGELYEKYKGGKLAPEISILLKLGITAAVTNYTNKALSSSAPEFGNIIKQSPEFMKAFTNATVDSMSQKSPGFAFASNLVNGGPPAPIETKAQQNQSTVNSGPRRSGAMEFTERPVRPDLAQARPMFKEQGVEINSNYKSLNEPDNVGKKRPEMRGPSEDIDFFLSGLKPSNKQSNQEQMQNINIHNDDSMISIASLKDMQNTKLPNQTKKRGKSEKNIISLDI